MPLPPLRAFSCATLLGALLIAPMPAAAQTPDHAPGSTNTVVRNLPLDFNEQDYGKIIELVVRECTGNTSVMYNGPYRRISNAASSGKNGPNPSGAPGTTGDARLDYIAVDGGNVPGGTSGRTYDVTSGDVSAQIGIQPASSSTTVIEANVFQSGTGTYTYRDTSPTNSQILDVGPDVGGPDAIVFVKNGTPKTMDLVCDMNMYFLDPGDPRGFQYGVKDFFFPQQLNRVIALYAAGPSPAGSNANVTTLCDIVNPPGKVPLRADDGSYVAPTGLPVGCPPLGEELDPGQACVGNKWTREDKTDGLIGNVIRFFGDPDQPASFTGCGPFPAGYCDPTEPVPEAIEGSGTGAENSVPSGNACNRNRGLSGAPNVNISSTLQENAGQWLKIGGNWIYVQF